MVVGETHHLRKHPYDHTSNVSFPLNPSTPRHRVGRRFTSTRHQKGQPQGGLDVAGKDWYH